MALRKTYQRVKRFEDFNNILNEVLASQEKLIIDMNRDQMYEDGVMDTNNPSSILQYAPATIKQKKKRAAYPRTDYITLKWDGDFHKDIKVMYNKDSIKIYSDDIKWTRYLRIQDRFENAIGLTDESLDLLKDRVKYKLRKQFLNAI